MQWNSFFLYKLKNLYRNTFKQYKNIINRYKEPRVRYTNQSFHEKLNEKKKGEKVNLHLKRGIRSLCRNEELL